MKVYVLLTTVYFALEGIIHISGWRPEQRENSVWARIVSGSLILAVAGWGLCLLT